MRIEYFETMDQLADWLRSKEVNLSEWLTGKGNKTVGDLWAELESGESQLQSDPLIRIVRVVTIIIFKGSKKLVEDYQYRGKVYHDRRGLYPSEKLKKGETPEAAALRGLEEELKINPENAKILRVDQNYREEMRESRSYPGLMTKYIIYQVELRVDSLPDDRFITMEYFGKRDRLEVHHHWNWV